jgi:alkylhydroperoxidase family enzyme
MKSFIPEPKRIPVLLKLAIWIAEKTTGKDMLPARLLSWFPKAAVGSACLESLTAHGRTNKEKRLLRLVRLQTAFIVSCPFCVDMNAFEYEKHGVSVSEFEGLQNGFREGYPSTLSSRERVALEYSRLISATPLAFPSDFMDNLTSEFSEREIVMVAATVSQVNYWARLIQSLGIPPAGFTDECQLRGGNIGKI